MNSKKVIVIVVVFILSIFILKIGGDFLITCLADRVVEKIKQDYSPSRYGPGINPDKLEVDRIQKKNR